MLTISGEKSGTGSLTVFGSTFGAGIGGAYQKAGSDITIAGGTVYANAGDVAAGIGGSYEGSGNNITITGGTVYAYSGGGNDNYSETGQDGDNITVP